MLATNDELDGNRMQPEDGDHLIRDFLMSVARLL